MDLWKYTGKKVKLVDIDNKEWVGKCEGYTSDVDNDNGVASITIMTDPYEGTICFYENEIKSIKEI